MSNKVTLDFAITLPNGKTDRFNATLNLPKDFKIEQLGQDPSKFVQNAFILSCLSVSKGVGYGASWRGGPGAARFKAEAMCICGNIMRKYDRVMACVERGVIPGRIDGNGDLAVYSLLYLQLLEEFYPNDYKSWLSKEVIDFINQNTPPDKPLTII